LVAFSILSLIVEPVAKLTYFVVGFTICKIILGKNSLKERREKVCGMLEHLPILNRSERASI
ncbi:MAG TPA: hypothetical protein P5048_02770, partial [Chlamydiales bacterium]|nr:hypothetical protein [Chlamydiales bacterium]